MKTLPLTLVCVCLLVVSGCVGAIDDAGQSASSARPAGRGPTPTNSGVMGPGTPGEMSPGTPGAMGAGSGASGAPTRCGPTEAAASRAQRLTNTQYRATIRDLLLFDAAAAVALPSDLGLTGFDTAADGASVDGGRATAYQNAAEAIAAAVLAKPDVLARLVGCDGSADPTGCARRFVTEFGGRALRRPLTNSEVDLFLAVHARGATMYAGGTPFARGVALVVETVLQLPDFLYRVEIGADPDGDGIAPLSDFEVASRLSYMLWNSLPDQALFAEAAAGRLRTKEQVKAQAVRMAGDARFATVVRAFHRQWLDIEDDEQLLRDPKVFPAYSPDLGVQVRRELDRFISEVVVARNEGLPSLLGATYSFVNQTLAKVYGLSGTFTSTQVRAELDPARRAGLLTQPAFLAGHAEFNVTSPIRRGAFVHRRILCNELPDPPEDVDTKAPPLSPTVRTKREQVEAQTAPTQCRACHQIINPVGFAFEHFDGVGAWRDTDRGVPVDATGSTTLDEKPVSFDGAVSLIGAIRASEQASSCYTRMWIVSAYGRDPAAADLCTEEQLRVRMKSGQLSTKDLLVELTQTRSFLNHVVGR